MSQSTNREQARRTYWNEHDRESYRCADCQRSRRQIRGRFEVHHKDGNPSNNDLSNLVGLCRLCHNLREEKTLSKDAAEVVESIFEIKYSDKPTSKRGEYVANINPSTGLMFVPDIPIEPMKQFTREIWPTVMDERNWVPREEYR